MLDNILFSINMVLPIFIIVAIGFMLRTKDIINKYSIDSLSTIVFYVALPAKLFIDISGSDFSEILNLKFVLFSVLGTIASFVLLSVILLVLVKDKREAAAVIHGGFRSNFVYIGLPLIQNIIGKSFVPCVALIVVFVLPFYNILAVIILTYCNDRREKLKISSMLFDILKNPMIIATIVALPFSLLKINIPSFATISLNYLGSFATPIALLLIGASLNMKNFKKHKMKLTLIGGIYKVLIQPLIFIPLAIFLNFTSEEIVTLFVLFAAPTATNVYIMTKSMGGDAELGSSIIIVSLLMSILTLPVGVFLLKSIGVL